MLDIVNTKMLRWSKDNSTLVNHYFKNKAVREHDFTYKEPQRLHKKLLQLATNSVNLQYTKSTYENQHFVYKLTMNFQKRNKESKVSYNSFKRIKY
jgi:hypothetical protein